MPEYIERGTAIAKLTALEVTKPSATMTDAKRLLADMPTADVAPVTRCEDCLFWESGENECESWEWCKTLHHDMPSHAFCNFGVRKDDLPDDA